MKGVLLTGVLLLLTTSSCSQLMGGLRPDLDDDQFGRGPTMGGMWAERGFLSESFPEAGPGAEERFAAVGHSERGLASEGRAGARAQRSWTDGDRRESNLRDRYRHGANELQAQGEDSMNSFSNTPNLIPSSKRLYKNGNRATRADFLDESQNEGSLWAGDGQTNFFFSKNKVRGLGDILTVNLEADLVRDVALEIKRSLSAEEREMELAFAQEQVAMRAARRVPAANEPAASPAPAAAGAGAQARQQEEESLVTPMEDGVPEATMSDVDLSKALEVKAGDTMMAEIIERFPNGNYKIRGTKKIIYKRGSPRLLSLVAVVKGTDISEEDVLNSGKLYEYRLEAIR